jgi:hypothetical protein
MKDHVSDKSGAQLFKLDAGLPLPEFVKTASVISAEDVPGLEPNCFADVYTKSFPICSKADTWLSAAFFQKNASEDMITEARLRDACDMWGIDWDSTAVKPMDKTASAPDPVGQIEYKSGDKVLHTVQYFDNDQLNKIASDILEDARKYTFEIRQGVAKQLLKHAAEGRFTNDTVIRLQKCAGYGVGTVSAVEEAANIRRHSIPFRAEYDEIRNELLEMNKMAHAINQQGIISPEYLEKFAAALDHIDATCGKHYAHNLPAPEQDLFGVSMHEFDAYNNDLIKLANGRTYLSSRIDYRDMAEFLAVAFGKEAGEEQESIKTTMCELSGPNADLVSRYLDKKDEQQVWSEDSGAPDSLEDALDGDKEGGEPGIDWPSDESSPAMSNNEDLSPRKH